MLFLQKYFTFVVLSLFTFLMYVYIINVKILSFYNNV